MSFEWCTQNALQHEDFCFLSLLLRFIRGFLMNVCVLVIQMFEMSSGQSVSKIHQIL